MEKNAYYKNLRKKNMGGKVEKLVHEKMSKRWE